MKFDSKLLFLYLGSVSLFSCKTRNFSNPKSTSNSVAQSQDPVARLELPSRWLMDWPDNDQWKAKWAAWSAQKKITGTNLKLSSVPADATGKVNTEARSIWYNTSQGSFLAPAALFLAVKAANNTPFASPENLIKYGFIYPPADGEGETGFQKKDFLISSEYSYLGLPLGLTPDLSQREGVAGAMSIGPTCAACHTSEIVTDVKGRKTRVVVDGGQPLLDFVGFLDDFTSSLQKNELEPLCAEAKRIEQDFIKPSRMFYQDPQTCKDHVKATLDYLGPRLKRNQEKVKSGPGRLDALGNLVNELIVYHLSFDSSQGITPSAPISYPYLWSAPDMECVQTNCLTSDPLTRNLGEVSGVFGIINVGENADNRKEDGSKEDPVKTNLGQEAMNIVNEISKGLNNPAPFPRIRASSNPITMFILEDALKTLPSPKWEQIFTLDGDLAAKGKTIYEKKAYQVKVNGSKTAESQSCESCHVYVDNRNQNSFAGTNMSLSPEVKFIKSPKLRLEDVGTDSAFLAQATGKSLPTDKLPMSVQLAYRLLVGQTAGNLAKAQIREFAENPFKVLRDRLKREQVNQSPSLKERLDNMPALAAFGIVNRFAVDGWAADQGLNAEDMKILSHHHASVRPLDVAVYKSRPLNGIPFSSPYLHNGSVPSLSDLLELEGPRPSHFSVNTVSYDANRIGYLNDSSHGENGVNPFTLDTSIGGNQNSGHPWGTELSKDDKRALLEFLKTL